MHNCNDVNHPSARLHNFLKFVVMCWRIWGSKNVLEQLPPLYILITYIYYSRSVFIQLQYAETMRPFSSCCTLFRYTLKNTVSNNWKCCVSVLTQNMFSKYRCNSRFFTFYFENMFFILYFETSTSFSNYNLLELYINLYTIQLLK